MFCCVFMYKTYIKLGTVAEPLSVVVTVMDPFVFKSLKAFIFSDIVLALGERAFVMAWRFLYGCPWQLYSCLSL